MLDYYEMIIVAYNYLDCKYKYKLLHDSSERKLSTCTVVQFLKNYTIDKCVDEASSSMANVFNFQYSNCHLRKCFDGDLRIRNLSDSTGWNVYVRQVKGYKTYRNFKSIEPNQIWNCMCKKIRNDIIIYLSNNMFRCIFLHK